MNGGENQHFQNIYVILNPIAGHSSAEELRNSIDTRFQNSGFTFEIYETTGKENVAEITRTACKGGTELVIAAGGDGTVAGVVNGLKDSGIPLGIVPVGTGNGLARALGIPLDPEAALDLIAGDHKMIKLDAMQVGDQYYILNVSAGISARAMRDTPVEVKRRFGMLGYAWTIFKEIIGVQTRRFALNVDGHEVNVSASEILVSNGAFLKEPPFPLGPPEFFNDAQFDIYILTTRSLTGYIRIIWNYIFKGGRKSDLRHLTVKEKVNIDAIRRPQPVQADGEVIGHTPVEIQMVHDALNVIVPKEIPSNNNP